MFRCPNCGGVLHVSPETPSAADSAPRSSGGWTLRTLRPMNFGDSIVAETLREATRTTPHRAATRESDVIVPFQQAAITAGVITLPAAALTAASGWPVHVPVIVCAGSFTLAWFWLLRDSRSLLRITERIVNRDIDGDGRIGDTPAFEPPPRPTIDVNVNEPSQNGARYRYMNFPTSEAGLLMLARAVTGGRELTERACVGRNKPFAIRADFNEFRDQLISRGYAEWKGRDHRHGWELLPRGVELFKSLAARPTPLPQSKIDG